MESSGIKKTPVRRFYNDQAADELDWLAVEEPLEIRLEYGPATGRSVKSLSVTMRTPGADADLAAGFLFTEGIVRAAADIATIRPWGENTILVSLAPSLVFDMGKLERHFYTTSSCGVCGKTSVDALKTAVPCTPSAEPAPVSPEVICTLPETLRQAQANFGLTGGLHAAAFFNPEGKLIALREDVGRHNALDKLIGSFFLQGAIPVPDAILLLSGRASFELLQKAAMAGVQRVCAVGAPSSLAVETAMAFGIVLIGFLRENRFNQYTGAGVRTVGESHTATGALMPGQGS
jgi:FdhD protein